VSKAQVTYVSKCRLSPSFPYHKYLLAPFAESVGTTTTSQAAQPSALKVAAKENIKDTYSSCTCFELWITSPSAAKGEGLPKRVRGGVEGHGVAALRGALPCPYGRTGKH